MSSSTSISLLILLLFVCSFSIGYDIIVYTATPSGIAAAITAARTSSSLSILIIETTAYIGGMVSAGGIGLKDLDLEDAINGSVAQEWALNNRKYYKNVTHAIYQADMNIGTQSFLDLISKYPNIELITRTGPLIPVSLVMNGTRIVQITTATANDENTWKASVFIDASYEGDLVRYSGASYTWGRESRFQYDEPDAGVLPYERFANFLSDHPVKATLDNGTLAPNVSPQKLGPVGSGDSNIMTFTYRLCITTTKEKQAPFIRPTNYDPNDFIILQRYIDSLIATGKYPSGLPITALLDIYPYKDCPTTDIFDLNGSFNSAFTTDSVNLNQGYVNGTDEDRRRIAQATSDYVLGFIWYILTSPNVPKYTRNNMQRYGLCKDQWPELNHMTPQLYIREGLRLVNENVFTQNHVVSGLCRNDTIALGSWCHDVHVVNRVVNGSYVTNEGQMFKDVARVNGSQSGPAFEIPYSVLLPKRNEVTNLLVPVCHAASHVAYAATRLEPTFMLLGGAAGYFAAYSILNGHIDVQAVSVRQVQQALTRDGVPLHYPRGHCD